MAKYLIVAILVVVATICSARNLREKRQAYLSTVRPSGQRSNGAGRVVANAGGFGNQLGQTFTCPGDGPFSYPDDCSQFYQCDQGVAAVKRCPPGLEFNPQNNWCDYPANVQGGCTKGNSPRSLANAPCQGRASTDSYLVQHPSFCNAFFHCGNGYLYPDCTFCPQGSYFNANVGRCADGRGMDVNTQCSGKSMIEPRFQELARLEPSCRPGRNDSYAPLRAKIQGQPRYQGYNGGVSTGGGGYPNNGGYQPNGGVYPRQGGTQGQGGYQGQGGAQSRGFYQGQASYQSQGYYQAQPAQGGYQYY